jgi:hypothetical protein
MSYPDPTGKLVGILARVRHRKLPKAAGEWAEGALSTAQGILGTISEMETEGFEATDNQCTALENIDAAADNWLNPGNRH